MMNYGAWMFIGAVILFAVVWIYRFWKLAQDEAKIEQKDTVESVPEESGQVFCYNCDHCMLEKGITLDLSKCRRTKYPELDTDFFVTGKRTKEKFNYRYCSTERQIDYHTQCGPTGKFFEPKQTTKK
jgi:hypothetical protein